MYLLNVSQSHFLLTWSAFPLFSKLTLAIILLLCLIAVYGHYWWRSKVKNDKYSELASLKQALPQEVNTEDVITNGQLIECEKSPELNGEQRVLIAPAHRIEPTPIQLNNNHTPEVLAQKTKNIVFSTKTKTYKVKSDQLMYAVAENDGTRLYLEDKNFWLVLPFKKVIKQLPAYQFIQIFRSTIVNLDYINTVKSKMVILENGVELALSRTYKDEVKLRIGQVT